MKTLILLLLTVDPVQLLRPAKFKHNFQVIAGVAIRLGDFPDVGDTIIRYDEIIFPAFPAFTIPAETRHNLQVSSGIGFRFSP